MDRALEGVKILDLTRLLPGPFCTQILGDLGAEVIKIEAPIGGDYIRWYPPLGKTESSYFLGLNRNKKSVKLDLNSTYGQEIFYKLTIEADIIVEQYRPGTMEKLGLSYEILSQINPKLIMCSITGYGQNGSYRDMAGHDINYLSAAGILGLTKDSKGKPVLPAIQIADISGALWATSSILAALISSKKTGQGQFIDVSLTDCILPFSVLLSSIYFINNDKNLIDYSPLSGAYAWYNVYETKDKRWLAIGMLEYKFWRKFCVKINREDLVDKQYFPGPIQAEIIQELSELFLSKTITEWLQELDDVNMCVNEVYTLDNALNSNLIKERGLIEEINHPTEGKIRFLAYPVKLSKTPAQYTLHPPLFGQHTEEVLLSIGYSPSEINHFKTIGII